MRIILFFILVYFIGFLYKKLWKNNPDLRSGSSEQNDETPEQMAQDPVCKTYVPVSQAVKYSSKGKTLYFCSEECKNKYIKDKK